MMGGWWRLLGLQGSAGSEGVLGDFVSGVMLASVVVYELSLNSGLLRDRAGQMW